MLEYKNEIAFLPKYSNLDAQKHLNQFNAEIFENFAFENNQKLDWGLQRHLIPELWGITKGNGIKVAILDTGVAKHQDLNKDIVNIDFTGEKEIVDRHGTMAAGIIGAIDNDYGVVGVAPECKIYSAKVLKNQGANKVEPIINGLKWAIEDVKADVISMSLHISGPNKDIHNLIKRANDENRFVICAAGNKGNILKTINYPAKYEEAISVGSIGTTFTMAYDTSPGAEIDVVAPGIDICSTGLNNSYSLDSGTSFATPFVTGIVALMLAKHRKYKSYSDVTNVYQLREHLRKTSIDVVSCGKDNLSGYGLINPKSLIMGINLRN